MLVIAAAAALAATPAAAPETVISANPLGALGFTLQNIADFAVNAEHVRGHHGVVAEAALVHVHGDPTHSTILGGRVGYRFHGAETDAPFVGVLAGYGGGFVKYYRSGHANKEDVYRFDLRHTSLIPHVGYRWSLGKHGRVTSRLGAGWSDYDVVSDEKGDDVEAAIALTEDRLQFTPIKLDLELSVGFAF